MYLKEFRERLNLTQNELSLKLDIAQTTIARYENGKINPTSTIVFKYINQLNANPNFLFLGLLSSFLRLTILPLVFLMVVGTISKLGFAYTCLFSSSTLLRKALSLFTINY